MPAMLGCPCNNAFELATFKGLDEIVKCAAAKGIGSDLDIPDGREHDDG